MSGISRSTVFPLLVSLGILPWAGGLLISTFAEGALYWLDVTQYTVTTVLPANSTTTGDGLCMDDSNVLYICENTANKISAYQMDGATATLIGGFTSTDFDSPATCDISQGYLYTPNLRLNTLGILGDGEDSPGYAEEFTVVGVPLADIMVPTMAPTPMKVPGTPTMMPSTLVGSSNGNTTSATSASSMLVQPHRLSAASAILTGLSLLYPFVYG